MRIILVFLSLFLIINGVVGMNVATSPWRPIDFFIGLIGIIVGIGTITWIGYRKFRLKKDFGED